MGIEKYLTRKNIEEWGLSSVDICTLIEETGELEKYFTVENIQEWKLSTDDIRSVIVNERKNRGIFDYR